MRILKAVLLVLGCITIVLWFVAMAHIGIQNQDEWYGKMDKGTTQQDSESGEAIHWEDYTA